MKGAGVRCVGISGFYARMRRWREALRGVAFCLYACCTGLLHFEARVRGWVDGCAMCARG